MRISGIIVAGIAAVLSQGCKSATEKEIDTYFERNKMTPEEIAAFRADLEKEAAEARNHAEFERLLAEGRKEGISTADVQLGIAFEKVKRAKRHGAVEVVAGAANAGEEASEAGLDASQAVDGAADTIAAAGAQVPTALRTPSGKSHKSGSKA